MRHFGFGSRLSRTDVTHDRDDNFNTDVAPINAEIAALLAQEYARAQAVLKTQVALLLQIVQALLTDGQVSQQKMAELLGVQVARHDLMLMSYADQLKVFSLQHALMQRTQHLAGNALPMSAGRQEPLDVQRLAEC